RGLRRNLCGTGPGRAPGAGDALPLAGGPVPQPGPRFAGRGDRAPLRRAAGRLAGARTAAGAGRGGRGLSPQPLPDSAAGAGAERLMPAVPHALPAADPARYTPPPYTPRE